MLLYKYKIKQITIKLMKIVINLLKIISLALVISLASHFSYGYLFDGMKSSSMSEVQNYSDNWNNNKYKFKKSNTIILSNVWVALSTNIWIKYKERKTQNLYIWVPKIAKYISNKKFADKTNLDTHMLKISEYYNVLRTDIKWMLQSSYNRAEFLDSYIDQLKYRYKWTIIDIQSLIKKKAELTKKFKSSSEKIKKIKIKIDKDFRDLNYSQTNNNIKALLEARGDYNYTKTHIIFTNHYLKQYENLNNSNRKLLNVLINNKEALIRNSKVVIPKTGIEVLRKLDLIIDEK